MPTDDEVVETAAEAAQGFVFSKLRRSDIDDLDVTVTFEEGTLTVDVYVFAPDVEADLERIADDAALVAREAVDDLLEGS
ncbi:MAG: DUF3194 domain-containing protein [Halanaeroarchaeum sp.]